MTDKQLRCRAGMWGGRGSSWQCRHRAKGTARMAVSGGGYEWLPACGTHMRVRAGTGLGAYIQNKSLAFEAPVREYVE